MPTILDVKVSELAAGLDDKASQALVSQIDGISAISILHKLRQKAERNEVNNPSAFVSTAVRSAQAKGGAGPAELEAAIARLSEDGTLDDNAQEVLRKAPPRDALSGLLALLQMDPTNVRNPSAYVTRNVINCKKEGGPPVDRMGVGMMQGRQAQPQQFANVGLLSKWMHQLDPAAQEKLQQVGPMAAQQILQEMDSKATLGQVRNPSGYVSKSCDNFKGGISSPTSQQLVAAPSFHSFGSSPDLMRWHGVLDSDALQALEKVGPAMAAPILEKLQGQMGQVRNPSAYVIKGVANLGMLEKDLAPMHHAAAPSLSQQAQPRPRSVTLAALDESAQNSLHEIGGEAAEMILQELDSKGASVRNPSAFVVRAVANARRGEGTAAMLATIPVATKQVLPDLDERANEALEEIGPDAAATIVQNLAHLGSKVNNPSAYVLRAVNNAKRGQGAGGQAMAAEAQSAVSEMLEAFAQKLDGEAMSALSSAPPAVAGSVLSELESKWAEVKNPSAYVVRAVANAKKGQALSTMGSIGPRNTGRPAGVPQRHGGQGGGTAQLDAKALSALEEVGMASAAVILQKLHAQSGSITNPSAWVIRAVANEKRGQGGSDESPMKRMRLM